MPEGSLGEFEQLVLIAVLRLGEDAYGVSIAGDIAEKTGRNVSLGGVYKTLERLEDKGFVTGRIGLPTAERGGRRKKHYRILAAGQRALRQSMTAIRSMTRGLESDLRL